MKAISNHLGVLVYSACLTLLLLGVYANRLHTFRNAPDAPSYIAMAGGESDEVRLHHAKRVLYPLLVRGLSQFCDIHFAFYLAGSLSLFGFLTTSCTILSRMIGIHTYYALPLLCTPFLVDAFENLYYPGLLLLFLSALYFYFFLEQQYARCVLVLFALLLTRDEALIIAIVTLGVLIHRARVSKVERGALQFGVGVVIVLMASFICLKVMVGESENMHALSGVAFSVGRMPLFFMRNFTGFSHWVDAYSQLPYYPDEPIFKVTAPAWLQSRSSIEEIGIYSWNPSEVLSNWLLITTSFGTLATVIAFDAIRLRWLPPMPTTAHAVAAYSGGLLFFLGPIMGPPSMRYFAAAWPLFFISLGVRLRRLQDSHRSAAKRILLLSLGCSWLWWPYFYGYIHGGILLPIALLLHVSTWMILAQLHGKSEPGVRNDLRID